MNPDEEQFSGNRDSVKGNSYHLVRRNVVCNVAGRDLFTVDLGVVKHSGSKGNGVLWDFFVVFGSDEVDAMTGC